MEHEPSRRSFMAAIGATTDVRRRGRARDDPGGLAYRTAGELVKALADRQISARELLEASLARIEVLVFLRRVHRDGRRPLAHLARDEAVVENLPATLAQLVSG